MNKLYIEFYWQGRDWIGHRITCNLWTLELKQIPYPNPSPTSRQGGNSSHDAKVPKSGS